MLVPFIFIRIKNELGFVNVIIIKFIPGLLQLWVDKHLSNQHLSNWIKGIGSEKSTDISY